MSLIVFGHRGVPSLATENSINSFKMILKENIPAVELDVNLTKDKKLIVLHDFNTFRMTGISHEITETNYNTISSLSIGNGEKIPLLSEVFDILTNSVFYDIEIKSKGKNRKTVVKELYKIIKTYNLTNNCMISSFDPFILKEFNKLKSGIPIAIIYIKNKDVPLILRRGLGLFVTHIDIIKPHYKQLKGPLFYLYTKILKKKCFTWTVNSKEDFDYIKSRGCSGICSNLPQNFIS